MMSPLKIWLPDAKITRLSGESLAHTIYAVPTDILLTGTLGAGKTTFLQGFAAGLGVTDALTSPTYALEQRYRTPKGELIHIDLYRLRPEHAEQLIVGTDDHTGIRCIEWPDRLPDKPSDHPTIDISLSEEADGRVLTVSFEDVQLPSMEDVRRWRTDVALPAHIIAHCDAVADVATQLADHLSAEGTIVRREMLERAGQLHDLLRFIDFKSDAGPDGVRPDRHATETWNALRQTYAGMRHEEACAAFLTERGFAHLADVVRVHGLTLPAPDRVTVEQQLLFYADKRVALDKVVTLDERFDDFRVRYSNDEETERSRIWRKEAQDIEKLLFPDGTPL